MNKESIARKILDKLSQLDTARAMQRREEDALSQATARLEATLQAQKIIQSVAATLQQEVHARISAIVSRCLSSVFNSPYSFHIHFEQKRGKTEARIVFIRDGEEVDPTTEAGGGVVDVAAFALRIAALILSGNNSPTIILDEPLKFLSRNHAARVSQLLTILSEELSLQFILVTHDTTLQVGKVESI